MDLYLPADYLRLRDELDDWRDALYAPCESGRPADTAVPPAESIDPDWQAI
jgi:hypothetical protein